jgi:hypothetical protein
MSPAVDAEVLRRVPALRERHFTRASGLWLAKWWGSEEPATQRTPVGTGCKTPEAVTRSKPSRW